MLRQEVAGYLRGRQNDDGLSKNVDVDNGPVILAPFAIRPPAVRLGSLVDIANYRQWPGAGRQGQTRS
jgi:hypothetical protein